MTNKYYGKDKKRLRKEALKNYKNKYEEENDKAEKGSRKISKFYWRRKRKIKHQFHHEWNLNTLARTKKKLVEYTRNYYITHSKWLLGHFPYFFKDAVTIKFFVFMV